MQFQSTETESNAWVHIEPLLDTAMAQLGEKDHDAVVLRFLEGRSFKEVSTALNTSEAGAKMRVNRALEKLRKFFNKRGLSFPAALIAGAVSANSVQAAPIGLATSVTSTAVKGMAVTASTQTLIETTLKIMAWTKLKITVAVGAIAILAAGTATLSIAHVRAKAALGPFPFAGYATPEASLQSMLWSASAGDLGRLSAGATKQEMERFEGKMAGRSDDEIKRALVAWANAMHGYRITQKEVISEDEVHLHIRATPSAEALHSGKAIIIMKKIGRDWKQDGDA